MTTLGALCKAGGGGIQTGPFGSQLHASDYVVDGIPSVMPQNIGDNALSIDGISRISEFDANRLSKYLLAENDIVYSRRGDVEKRSLVRAENAGWLCGTGCLRISFGSDPVCDPRYISYYLGTELSRSWIKSHAVGATMPNLNTGILSAVPIEVPSIFEQRAIAEVLSAFDDKIAANRKLAETADDWIRSRYAGLARHSKEFTVMSDVVNQVRSGVDPSDLLESETYVGLEHIPRRLIWMTDSESASVVTSVKSRFSAGDILFGKLRPYFHKVVSASVDGVCSTDVLVLQAKSPALSGWAMAALSSDFVVERATAASEGTRMPRAKWVDIAAIELPWPGDEIAEAFSQDVTGIRSAIVSLIAESRTLESIRDTLLPQLMFGKLRVRDAEKQVEAVL